MSGGGSQEVKPTADQNAQQQVNAKLWNYYQANYQPFIDKYSKSTLNNQAGRAAAVAGETNAEVMKQMPRPTGNVVNNAMQTAGAEQVSAGAQQNAANLSKQRELASMENLVNIGRGQATQAIAGLNDLASQSIQQEIGMHNIAQEQTNSNVSAAGSAIGAGLAISSRPTNKTLASV